MHLQSPPLPVATPSFSAVCKEVAWHSSAFATTKRKQVGTLMFNQGSFLLQSKWPAALRSDAQSAMLGLLFIYAGEGRAFVQTLQL